MKALWILALSALAGFAAVYVSIGRPDNAFEPAATAQTTPPPATSGSEGTKMAAFVKKSSPQALPDITFKDADGKDIALSNFKGKTVLLNLWATWCAPCREEIPALMALREQLHDRDFEVVGIAIDGADKVRGYAGDMRISYPILIADFSAIDWMRRLGNKPGALPFSLVLDRNGSPAAQHLGLLTVESARRLVAPALGL